jgi:hypothetical protein
MDVYGIVTEKIIALLEVGVVPKLAEIYGWFTEGFEFADLKDAKALLEQL